METLQTLINSRYNEFVTSLNVGNSKDYTMLKEAIDYVNSENYYDKYTDYFINCLN